MRPARAGYEKSTFVVIMVLIASLVGVAMPEGTTAYPISSTGYVVYSTTARPIHVEGNKIKDDNGNIVFLRGSNYFLYRGDMNCVWLTKSGSHTYPTSDWATQVVPVIIDNFDSMKTRNFNCLRIHTTAENWLNTTYILHMQELATLAADRGIYIMFDFFDISNTIGGQNTMPYPPYISSEEAQIIPDVAAYVNIWVTIANAMKDRPNTLFNLFNEPVGNREMPTDYDSMLNAYQQCISAIRQICSNLIVVEWGYQIGVNMPWGIIPPGVRMDVFANDPRVQGTNMVYAFHFYEDNPQNRSTPVNSVDAMEQYMEMAGIDAVVSSKPLVIGELGGKVGDTYALTWMNNAIDAAKARGIGLLTFAWSAPWSIDHQYRLVDNAANFPLTDRGILFVEKIADY